jgi:hypothetical protein
MRKTLSDKGVAALKPRAARYALPDPELRGHYIRVQPSDAKSFVAVAVDPQSGKQVWTTIGAADAFGIDEARAKAREIIKRVRAGLPPIEAKGETFGDVAANWLKRHVEQNGLRSKKQIERLLRVYVFPTWKDRVFLDFRRSDVAALLDQVEDNHGPRQADVVLTVVRSVMNWFATRIDNYHPPIVRGMKRQNAKAHARAHSRRFGDKANLGDGRTVRYVRRDDPDLLADSAAKPQGCANALAGRFRRRCLDNTARAS